MVLKQKKVFIFSLSHPVVGGYSVFTVTMRLPHPPEDTTVIASS